MDLKEFFSVNNKIGIGFSGGVDSSYLLWAAKKYGADVSAYFIKTEFQPAFEFEDAKKIAEYVGVEIKVIEMSALESDDVSKNDEQRCYYCKNRLFSAVKARAEQDGYVVLIDGTNASDSEGDRPGMKAAHELGVLSPLRDCGLTKAMVRELSKEAGLFTWNKPSYACLATRIETNTKITKEQLTRVEEAEDFLRGLGFSDFRVRLFKNCARIQLKDEQLTAFINNKKEIFDRLKNLFDAVFLDLNGR